VAEVLLLIDGQEHVFAFDRLVLGGYSGRSEAEVEAHIAELQAYGVPRPNGKPIFLMCSPHLLTSDNAITVLGEQTSGEAEFALFLDHGGIMVAVGSDHTDRALEKVDISYSKQICPKVISKEAWRYDDVKDHWDELKLRSWVGEEGRENLYQESSLKALLPPETLVANLQRRVRGTLDRTVLFSGTVPLIGSRLQFLSFFAGEIEDPVRRRRLGFSYRVEPLNYVR